MSLGQWMAAGQCEADLQRVPYSTRIPGHNIICTLEDLAKRRTVYQNGLDSGAAGSTCSNFTSTKGREQKVGSITWIEEDGTELLGSRGILDYRKTCIASRGVVIVHRDL